MIFKISHLSKTYSNGTQALRDVSLEIKEGEFLAIIGLSGSGKSTLLRCMNGLHRASSGQILFKGREITNLQGREVRELRQKVAMIFQQFNLVGRQSVLTNVLMGSLSRTSTLKSLLGLFGGNETLRAENNLKLVGLLDKKWVRADELSGGQQQRVAIARALTQMPEVLLADEPVASLDPATCHTIMNYLKEINRDLGLTIVCNLHFLSLVREYATRVIALRAGEVVYQGAPSEITENWFREIYGDQAKEVYVK